jgi:hypothetical protein
MDRRIGVDEAENFARRLARAAVACRSYTAFRDRYNASPMMYRDLGGAIG